MNNINGAYTPGEPRLLVLSFVDRTFGSVLGRLDKYRILDGSPFLTELVEKHSTCLLAEICVFRDVIEGVRAAEHPQNTKDQ